MSCKIEGVRKLQQINFWCHPLTSSLRNLTEIVNPVSAFPHAPRVQKPRQLRHTQRSSSSRGGTRVCPLSPPATIGADSGVAEPPSWASSESIFVLDNVVYVIE